MHCWTSFVPKTQTMSLPIGVQQEVEKLRLVNIIKSINDTESGDQITTLAVLLRGEKGTRSSYM